METTTQVEQLVENVGLDLQAEGWKRDPIGWRNLTTITIDRLYGDDLPVTNINGAEFFVDQITGSVYERHMSPDATPLTNPYSHAVWIAPYVRGDYPKTIAIETAQEIIDQYIPSVLSSGTQFVVRCGSDDNWEEIEEFESADDVMEYVNELFVEELRKYTIDGFNGDIAGFVETVEVIGREWDDIESELLRGNACQATVCDDQGWEVEVLTAEDYLDEVKGAK